MRWGVQELSKVKSGYTNAKPLNFPRFNGSIHDVVDKLVKNSDTIASANYSGNLQNNRMC